MMMVMVAVVVVVVAVLVLVVTVVAVLVAVVVTVAVMLCSPLENVVIMGLVDMTMETPYPPSHRCQTRRVHCT
jgi:hypothetical protein